jgi:hypothetical protein
MFSCLGTRSFTIWMSSSYVLRMLDEESLPALRSICLCTKPDKALLVRGAHWRFKFAWGYAHKTRYLQGEHSSGAGDARSIDANLPVGPRHIENTVTELEVQRRL